MAVIRFTAANRDELPSWLSAGATFYLANQFEAYPRRLVAKREIDETLDGTPESYLHALQREYAIRTDFIPLSERDLWRAFFTSVLNAESFAIDFSAQQLLGNPGFETGAVTPWAAGSASSGFAATATPGLPAIGTYAGQFSLVITASNTCVQNSAGAGAASQSFLFQGLAKRSESSVPNRGLELQVAWIDGVGSEISAAVIGTAGSGTIGYQLLNGVPSAAPANTASVVYTYRKAAPHNTTEAGSWIVDHALCARLSSWTNVWLVDNSVEEQQIGGVGVRYSFRVKSYPS